MSCDTHKHIAACQAHVHVYFSGVPLFLRGVYFSGATGGVALVESQMVDLGSGIAILGSKCNNITLSRSEKRVERH